MKEEIRRTIVYAAAVKIRNEEPRSIFSFSEGKYTYMSNNYDYGSGSYVNILGNNLYHYGLNAHINLNINGMNFSGYDYNSGSHFQGTVNGNRVQVYDYGDGRYYNYQV